MNAADIKLPTAMFSQMSADLIFFLISHSIQITVSITLFSFSYIFVVWSIRAIGNISRRKKLTENETNYYSSFSQESRETYYKYVREEIRREDEITHHRLTWAITFQGFLVNALGIMIVFTWADMPVEVFFLRKLALLAIGIIGLVFGILAFNGVIASRNSIDDVKLDWERRNQSWQLQPHRVPQTFGQGGRFRGGTLYAVCVPVSFAVVWSIYLLTYTSLTSAFWLSRCPIDAGVDRMAVAECLYRSGQPTSPADAAERSVGARASGTNSG